MSEILSTLVEMGFNRDRAELAISRTKAENVEDAMEWLLTNEEEVQEPIPQSQPDEPPQDDTSPENVEEKANTEPQEKASQEAASPQEAKSIKCDECGKLFRTQTEVEFHAAKSGHNSFSESSEEKKPLTEDEKREQLAKIEAKLRQRRLEREAREKEEELEKEKNRIRSGKDLLEAKRRQEEAEIKKVIEQRKREKQEEKLARERVKQQIEQDRLARKAMFGEKGNEVPTVTTNTATPTTANTNTLKSSASQNYSHVKLQIRLTNGNTLTQTFGAKEPLAAVRLYVEMNRTDAPGPFALRTSFPQKVFSTDDYEKPLELLGLAPTAVLIVSRT